MQSTTSQRASLCVPPMNPAASSSSLSKMQSAHNPSMVVEMAKMEHSMAVVTEEKTLALDDVVVV
jgi:hypothetical protein